MLKDDGVDPQGGVMYSRYERCRVEKVYTQSIDKERTLREEARQAAGGAPPKYVMNLANGQRNQQLINVKHSHSRLEIITEKVEKQSPKERMSSEGFDPNCFEVNAMKHTEKTPTQKWDLPCTRAQEVGWLIANPATFASMQRRHREKQYPSGAEHAVRADPALSRGASAPNLGLTPHLPSTKLDSLDLLNNRRFYKPKTFCPITKYADTYVSLMHHDPFHKSATR
mmetsp:Transcript_37186/g.105777  ORF Transcript_37186/g.105777 Transcript_37186/m.105777 type:complete len:226 (-) Transcript_37186:109-786(-)